MSAGLATLFGADGPVAALLAVLMPLTLHGHTDGGSTVRLWQDYTPTITGVEWIMSRVDPNAPVPPPDSGVRFIDEAALGAPITFGLHVR